MPEATDPSERLEALLDKAEPRIARAFVAAINQLGADLDLEKLAEMLARGDYEGALAYTQEIARQLGHTVNLVFVDAGQDTARFLSGLGVGSVLFDQVNEWAVREMRESSLRLINEFTDEQRRATHLALSNGIARGDNPIEQARNFRDSVGLTATQQAAVDNYRRLLEGDSAARSEAAARKLTDGNMRRSIKSSIRNKVPLKPEQIDRMVTRYRERYIKYRAEVIARTEALRAVHSGSEESYRQAIAEGKIDGDRLTRKWDSSKDKRVRDTHLILHGQKRKWGEVWETIHGPIRFPGDPDAHPAETIQCRCLLTSKIGL